jgi:phosphate transport system ATP-binding protein
MIASKNETLLERLVPPVLSTRKLSAFFGNFKAVREVSMDIHKHDIVALIGPSGCGKSTFLRCLNRLHEEVPSAKVSGEVLLEDRDIYSRSVNPVEIRARIGMVFQKANPFPSMSIYQNVVAGLTIRGVRNRKLLREKTEQCLKQSALWDEVKDKLNEPGISLSGGQQQRLCIARALAVDPTVLLMDEPTSALDPIATAKIEELMNELKKQVTVVVVTHNMQQALRIADKTAFFLMGELIEFGQTQQVFKTPKNEQTEHYISGRFG